MDSLETVLELCGFVEALLRGLAPASEERWRETRVWLLLQLLCACQRCLGLRGDCRPLLNLMEQLVPVCQQVGRHRFAIFITIIIIFNFYCPSQELPLDELLMGTALLLLEAPPAQQNSMLRLGK